MQGIYGQVVAKLIPLETKNSSLGIFSARAKRPLLRRSWLEAQRLQKRHVEHRTGCGRKAKKEKE